MHNLLSKKQFPPLLQEIHDPPDKLHYQGVWPDASRPHLAVVGSRKATHYGKDVTRQLIRTAAKAGVVIVSGLAYGIDQIAHETTVQAGGTTIAVLGFGIEHPGTSRERQLKQSIIQSNGLLISEFDPQAPGHKSHFPKRNRVISGLCHATLIIEATEKSGSLITARLAMEQNRDVLCVPGPITSDNSRGTNRLIREGATPITCEADLLHALGIEPESNSHTSHSPEQQSLITLLATPQHIDQLYERATMPHSQLMSTLCELELAGHITQLPGQFYARV